MDIIYYDDNIIVAVKPAGVISTDDPGGMPTLLREALGRDDADIRTVHRLDQVVSGLMVLRKRLRPPRSSAGRYAWASLKRPISPSFTAFRRSAGGEWRISCSDQRSSARPSS